MTWGLLCCRLHGSLYTERCHSAFVVAWQRRFQRLETSAGVRVPPRSYM